MWNYTNAHPFNYYWNEIVNIRQINFKQNRFKLLPFNFTIIPMCVHWVDIHNLNGETHKINCPSPHSSPFAISTDNSLCVGSSTFNCQLIQNIVRFSGQVLLTEPWHVNILSSVIAVGISAVMFDKVVYGLVWIFIWIIWKYWLCTMTQNLPLGINFIASNLIWWKLVIKRSVVPPINDPILSVVCILGLWM